MRNTNNGYKCIDLYGSGVVSKSAPHLSCVMAHFIAFSFLTVHTHIPTKLLLECKLNDILSGFAYGLYTQSLVPKDSQPDF